MPRRSRPTHRAPPARALRRDDRKLQQTKAKVNKHLDTLQSSQSVAEEEFEDESFASGSADGYTEEEVEDNGNGSDEGDWEDEAEDLPDAARVAQWVDEDELDKPGSSTLTNLQEDLAALPLGTLRKARLALPEAVAEESDDSDSDAPPVVEGDEESAEEETAFGSSKKDTHYGSDRIIAKRAHKHAPVEVTSKRPVTRRMQVVEIKKQAAGDPRFLPLAGEFSEQKFRQAYGFLADNRQKELGTLKETLKRARKLLVTSPRHLYEEREEEVKRLELAVKRAESQVNRDRRERVEHDALTRLAKEEKLKRKEGKGEWHMKKSNKREVLARARYDALAADGGDRAVKKAIEKKQRKIGQKEKKSRPFSMKRRPEAESLPSGRDSKRRKVG